MKGEQQREKANPDFGAACARSLEPAENRGVARGPRGSPLIRAVSRRSRLESPVGFPLNRRGFFFCRERRGRADSRNRRFIYKSSGRLRGFRRPIREATFRILFK